MVNPRPPTLTIIPLLRPLTATVRGARGHGIPRTSNQALWASPSHARGHGGWALLLCPPTPATYLPPGSLGFLQLGAQGLSLAGCSRLSLLGLLQPLEQFFLPSLGIA